jgi:hypothetical protein
MIMIDIQNPQAIELVREAIQSERGKKNLDAIAEARQLVLGKYQFFPYFANELDADGGSPADFPKQQTIVPRKAPLISRGRRYFTNRLLHKMSLTTGKKG